MDPAASPETPKPEPGLPPVRPPSGRFIAQLFVIPGLIILVLVLIILASNFLVTREHAPAQILQRLDSDNADIRWRGASDLAQILKRGEPAALRWKADASFALDLTQRLDDAWKALLEDEKRVASDFTKRSDKDRHLLWRSLRPQRDHVAYLAAALGEFHVAAGAPILCELLQFETSLDLKGNTLQRRMTLWALMNMGENLKGVSKVSPEQKEAMLATLKVEKARTGARGKAARTALFYLDRSALNDADSLDIVKVDERLARLADAEDQFLRKLVAMSFNFWDGPLAEPTLLKLSRDQGHGTLVRVEESD